MFTNKAVTTNKKRQKPINAGDIWLSSQYYRCGTLLPYSVIGSKAYMKKKWLQLIAIVCEKCPGDIFLTLTANVSLDTLKSILAQYPNPSPVLHPVDVSEYFFKVIFKGVFGEVELWWYKVESQN